MNTDVVVATGISEVDAGLSWYCIARGNNATTVDIVIATRKRFEYFL